MKRWGVDAQTARDAATLLPVAGAVLLLPPFILLFAANVWVAGIPLIVVYVFGVWAAIIFGAWLVARRHAEEPESINMPFGTDVETGEPPQRGRR